MPAVELDTVEGADSVVIVRLMAAFCGSAVVLILAVSRVCILVRGGQMLGPEIVPKPEEEEKVNSQMQWRLDARVWYVERYWRGVGL